MNFTLFTRILAVLGLGAVLALGFSGKAEANHTVVLKPGNFIQFNSSFNARSVAIAQQNLLELSKNLDVGEPIYLILDSPGGSVISGAHLIETARTVSVRNPVHTITLFAASMGYQTVQALGTRFIVPSGILMSHRMYVGGLSGQIPGELDTMVKFFNELNSGFDTSVAKRVGLSVKDYQTLIQNEYWATADKAVTMKHADKVVNVVCSKELISTKEEVKVIDTSFGQIELNIVASNCPMVRTPLEIVPSRGHWINSKEREAALLFFSDKSAFFVQHTKKLGSF